MACRIDRPCLVAWLQQTMPLILIIYDGQTDRAYWLYVQAHFKKQTDFYVTKVGEQVTVHIPKVNEVNLAAMRRFAFYRYRIWQQARQVVHHEE